jgi:hypothetical protein
LIARIYDVMQKMKAGDWSGGRISFLSICAGRDLIFGYNSRKDTTYRHPVHPMNAMRAVTSPTDGLEDGLRLEWREEKRRLKQDTKVLFLVIDTIHAFSDGRLAEAMPICATAPPVSLKVLILLCGGTLGHQMARSCYSR